MGLRELLTQPIVQAPMAGGGSCPALVAAVSGAGGLGFLAAGYKTAAQVRDEIVETRSLTSRPFGVNLFVPSAAPVDGAAVAAYQERLAPEAARLGTSLGVPVGGDDDWDAKVAELLTDPPAVVGFTFGVPALEVIKAFQDRGVLVVVTVTSAAEAASVPEADALCVQGAEAGAHRGSFTNDLGDGLRLLPLLAAVRQVTDRPLIATGGLGSGGQIAEVLAAGAVAAQLGTAFLRSAESGAHPVHKAALADPRFTATAVTRAFSGRPARGLVNRFMTEHSAVAPAAYPQVHNLTSPLRRAAARQGDAGAMALWAGESFRLAT
ncbi:MAG: nitronate monooxygenase, partial [Actinomadura sp.]